MSDPSTQPEKKSQVYGRCDLWRRNAATYSNHLNEHPKYKTCVHWKRENTNE
jgi:hypothetical protein